MVKTATIQNGDKPNQLCMSKVNVLTCFRRLWTF